MRALVMWSDDTSTNLGVRALAAGVESACRLVWDEVDVTYASYGFKHLPIRLWNHKELGLEIVARRRGFAEWMSQFDVLLDTRAGDSFADIYGLDRHLAMTMVGEVARQARTPVVLTPQTIGPFSTRRAQALARRSLSTADVAVARDLHSAQVARDLGRGDVLESTDVVFALPRPSRSGRFDVLLNVSGLLWQPNQHVDHAHYRRVVTELVARLQAEGRRVTLLSHVLESDDHDKDTPACRELMAALGADLELVVPEGLDHVRELVAGADLVIGSRMHACLNALSVGTPAIALAYSRKFAPLMNDIGWTLSVDLREGTDQVAQVMAAAAQHDLTDQVASTLHTAETRLGVFVDALRDLR